MSREYIHSCAAMLQGFPWALIEDYLDQAESPSIDGLFAYRQAQEDEYNAQVRWDASQSQNPVNPGGYQGNASKHAAGFAALIGNVKM